MGSPFAYHLIAEGHEEDIAGLDLEDSLGLRGAGRGLGLWKMGLGWGRMRFLVFLFEFYAVLVVFEDGVVFAT